MIQIFLSSFRLCVSLALVFLSGSIYAQGLVAIIETSKGVIEAELNDRAAPTTVANFANLAIRGFYDGLTFHRVERNFMVQGGDPLGNGSGGPGYRFAGEIILKHNQPGILSMANSGPGTDGSQFFLTYLATPHLDGIHSVFGKVINGQRVIFDIQRRDVINSISIKGDPTNLFKRKAEDLETWNRALDRNYPDLKPAFDIGNN